MKPTKDTLMKCQTVFAGTDAYFGILDGNTVHSAIRETDGNGIGSRADRWISECLKGNLRSVRLGGVKIEAIKNEPHDYDSMEMAWRRYERSLDLEEREKILDSLFFEKVK